MVIEYENRISHSTAVVVERIRRRLRVGVRARSNRKGKRKRWIERRKKRDVNSEWSNAVAHSACPAALTDSWNALNGHVLADDGDGVS